MTQEELDALLVRVADQARAVNIPVSRHICPHVRLNCRARTRFGCCIRRGGTHTIELSAQLVREGGQGAVARVLAHEVLHTCYGCANHGPRWKGYAQRMNDAYGYAIRRTDDYASLGLEDDRPVRYYVVCQRCARRIPRMKRSPLVDHPERYRCPCGGTLRVERAGDLDDMKGDDCP
ncbi:MAG: SprT family zinc-dependent metalloprotease [Oscillospiraceae bacterium]|jgi:predicted SprT family Zn-dependent metalloprotease|nr:SprT family zinc-dependent metalloprotease [Oscillospiraceae bacterium]